MGKLVGIFGQTGRGKTTSTIVNENGSLSLDNDGCFDYKLATYTGMNPDTHIIINTDRKALPLPGDMWSVDKGNYIETSELSDIKDVFEYAASNPNIKSVSLDTLNIYLAYKEFNERKKMSYDDWKNISMDIIELTQLCNNVLRPDQLGYIFGHLELVTDIDGKEVRQLAVIGKKARKQEPESFFPIVLIATVVDNGDGDIEYSFETKANRSSAKTPIGMFKGFRIPNSLSLVDSRIRNYYKIA